ncbi:MAG: hypothetical protein ACLGIG_13045 [Actinomycetes bacterium]
MTQPDEPAVPSGLAETAAERPEESVAKERDAVGDHPDTGDLVPPEQAQ